jgi:hypothetical protein
VKLQTSQGIGSFTGRVIVPREVFSVDWGGLEELAEYFDRFEESFVFILMDEYKKFGLLLEEGAKALAPEDEGDLVDSLNFTGLKVLPNGVEGEVGSNLVYALRRHEEPYRAGSFPKYQRGGKFPDYYEDGRGLTTRAKGSWRGFPAGRKYLENAVKATEEYYNEMLQRILERAVRGA